MKLIKTVTKEFSTKYTEFSDGSNKFTYEDDVLVRVETLSFEAEISNSDNSLIDISFEGDNPGTTTNLMTTLQVLKILKVPYRVEGGVLIITPTTSPLYEVLPGSSEISNIEDVTELYSTIGVDPLMDAEYIARKITSLCKYI